MTLNEFKAWLEGYEASFGANLSLQDQLEGKVPTLPTPNPHQWAKIKEKLETVTLVVASPPQATALRGGALLPGINNGVSTDARFAC